MGNREHSLAPTSFRQLAELLGFDRAAVYRWMAGQHVPSAVQASGLCSLLRADRAAFFPEAVDWITRTSKIACRHEVTDDDARAYAAYVFENGSIGCELDPHTVVVVAEEMQWSVQQTTEAILRVAQHLETVL